MNCKRCQRLFHEYLDETVSLRVRTAVERHLQGCNDCREALVGERDFSRSVCELLHRKAVSLALGPDARHNVLKALASDAPSPKIRKSYRRVLLRPAVAVVTAACLLAVAIVAFKRDKIEPARPVTPGAPHPKSYIICMATTYTDDTKSDWIERRMIVETKNGVEGYLNIIARKPPKVNETQK